MSYIRLEDFTTKVVTLTRQKLAMSQTIGAEMIEHSYMSVDELAGMFAGDLVARLETYVQAERLPSHEVTDTNSVSITMPTTWWQHFKQQYSARWFMRAFVKRHPVQVITRTSEATLHAEWKNMATYPFSDYVTPLDDTFGRAIMVTTLDHWTEKSVTQR